MKFKFCGDLDAPDFLLKEIDTLSKISVVRIKLIVAQVVKGILGEQIDVILVCFSILLLLLLLLLLFRI
jgi:phosphotransferase system  glucose/maltose/N-acetylglucosamine-specific IIC component